MAYEAIYQIGDIHVDGRRYDEYVKIIQKFADCVKADKRKKIITILGDTFEKATKLDQGEITLFNKICEILLSCKTEIVIILGNHDYNIHKPDGDNLLSAFNLERITVEWDGKTIFPFKIYTKSDIYTLNNIDFYVYSPTDKVLSAIKQASQNVKVLLLHETINGCMFQNRTIAKDQKCSLKLTDFNKFDIVEMGDVHKQQFLGEKKNAAYAGSLVQQDFGEDLHHGYIVWDLKTYQGTFHEIFNEYAYLKFYANGDKIVEPDIIPVGIKKVHGLRFEYENCTNGWVEKKQKEIKEQYGCEFSKPPINYSKISDIYERKGDTDSKKNDVIASNDIEYQQKMLTQMAKEKKYDEPMIKKLLEFHLSNRKLIEKYSGKRWKLLSLRWENVLKYGENNVIDFSKVKGLTSLIGKNATGKSTVIDALSAVLFNEKVRGNKGDMVRKGQLFCKMEAVIEVMEGNETNIYTIINVINSDNNNHGAIIYKNGDNIAASGMTNVKDMMKELLGPYEVFINVSVSIQNSNIFTDESKSKQDIIMEVLSGLKGLVEARKKYYDELKDLTKDKKALIEPPKSVKMDEPEIIKRKTEISSEIKLIRELLAKLNDEQSENHQQNSECTSKLMVLSKEVDLAVQSMLTTNKQYETTERSIQQLDKQKQQLEKIKKKVLNYSDQCLFCQSNKKLVENRTRIQSMKTRLIQFEKDNNSNSQHNKQIDERIVELRKIIELKQKQLSQLINKKLNIESVYRKIEERDSELTKFSIDINAVDKEIKKLEEIDHLNQQLTIAQSEIKSISDIIDNHKKEYPVTFNLDNCEDCKRNKSLFNSKFSINKLESQLQQLLTKESAYKTKLSEYPSIDSIKIKMQIRQLEKLKTYPKETKDYVKKQIDEILDMIRIANIEIKLAEEEIGNVIIGKLPVKSSKEIENLNAEIKNIESGVEKYSKKCNSCEDNKSILEFAVSKRDIDIEISTIDKEFNQNQIKLQLLSESKTRNLINYEEKKKQYFVVEAEVKEDQKNLNIQRSLITAQINENNKKLEGLLVNEMEINATYQKFNDYKVALVKYHSDSKQMDERIILLTYYVELLDLKNGFPRHVSNRFMSMLNDNMNRILSELTDFKISIEAEIGESIRVYIIKDNVKINCDMISGFQKFLLNIVFRISLYNVSHIPMPKFIIIDEGFGSLDIDNYVMVGRLLKTIKKYYDFVLIISHIQGMEDISDTKLIIQVNNGISYLNNFPDNKPSFKFNDFKRDCVDLKKNDKPKLKPKAEPMAIDIKQITDYSKSKQISTFSYKSGEKYIILFKRQNKEKIVTYYKCLVCEISKKYKVDADIMKHISAQSHKKKFRGKSKQNR